MAIEVNEYSKIESLYDRNEKTYKFKHGEFRLSEFEYLYKNYWLCTEKIDGTNIRIIWDKEESKIYIKGKSANAQIPTFLYDKLITFFPAEKFKIFDVSMCLYGEGYGNKIQKIGKEYIPDDINFILFDVRIGEWWLEWDSIIDIADKLDIKHVPLVGIYSLEDIEKKVQAGFASYIGNCQAEGVVCKPLHGLLQRNGKRIITKLKTKDFERETVWQ